MCSYVALHVCVDCLLQNTALHKAAQEGSIPHQSTQQSSVQRQPTVQYAIPNKKAAKNQDHGVHISLTYRYNYVCNNMYLRE